jgi:aspartate/methionine/tyrosine aminotransferase
LLASPNNPLGTTYTADQLSSYLAFCKDRSLHLISDEIYAASVFSPPDFVSVLTVIENSDDDTKAFAREHVHVLYGISKDLGLAGFRLGIIHTQNKRLAEATSTQLRFSSASSVTQRLMTPLLEDDAFLDHFFQVRGLVERHVATFGYHWVTIVVLNRA